MQTVLVAGGSGFIGSHLCARLLKEGYHVICVDSFLTSTRDNIASLENNSNFSFIHHNVIEKLDDALHADFVFHLASPASPNHHSAISYHALPMETMLVNTAGTLELLKFSEKNNAKFLFASTSEVYGDPEQHPQKEEYRGNVSTTGPRSVYDESKRFGETLTAYFWREKKIDARIARIFNTYGPNMRKDDKRMIVNFINQALHNKPINIFGDGKQTRSLCFIDDMVEGLFRLMFYPSTMGKVVNLGATEEYTVLEYATMIQQITNSHSEIAYSESLPVDDPLRRRPDITRAHNLLDWSPHVPLTYGLQKTVDYFQQA